MVGTTLGWFYRMLALLGPFEDYRETELADCEQRQGVHAR